MIGVRYEVDGHTATVTIDRQERRNALDAAALDALARAWHDADGDDAVRAVILTGAGDEAFSAGADLKEDWTGSAPSHDAFFPERTLHKPLIAAVNGICVAGGLELLLACDIRIAAEHATFALPEARVGLFPGGGSAARAPRRLAWSDAMWLLFTGDTIDAQHARRVRLVSHVVPASELRTTARAIAERVAACSPDTVRAIKRAALETDGMPLLDALAAQASYVRDGSARAREGIDAFREKRAPRF